jgi:hypothetical protein
MTATDTGTPAKPAKPKKAQKRSRWRRGWKFYVAVGVGVPAILLSIVTGVYYVKFSRMIDARLHGEMQRTDPRVFARPFELHRGP